MKKHLLLRAVCLCLLLSLSLVSFGSPAVLYATDGASSGQTTPPPASSSQQTLAQRQAALAAINQKLAELRSQMSALEKTIKNGQAQANAARQQETYFKQEASLLEEQIVLKQASIDHQVLTIEMKQLEIVQKQKDFDQNQQLFCRRLVAIYKMNDASDLSILLTVDSLSSFLAVSKNLQTISRHDVDLLTLLQQQRVALEAAKVEMEAMLAQLQTEKEEMNATLAQYKASAAAAHVAYAAAITQIAESEADKEALSQQYAAFQAQMEEIWRTLPVSTITQYVGGSLEWPVPGYNGDGFISSHFGNRLLYGRPNFHTGIDIARGSQGSIMGAAIVAANNGQVVKVVTGSNSGYGNYLIIDHGGGVRTLYGHCSSIGVSVGQGVTRGQAVAAVGNTGNSTGPHLHFELRLNGQATNPYPYLSGQRGL